MLYDNSKFKEKHIYICKLSLRSVKQTTKTCRLDLTTFKTNNILCKNNAKKDQI